MPRYKPSLYLISVLLFMLILPLGSIAYECLAHRSSLGWELIGKWFVFWSVGVRLFIAGIRQVSRPAFTAREIFHFSGEESFVVIRELGFANLSIGLIGILSMIKTDWCHLAAIGGGLFFGLAGIQHLFKKPDSGNEMIALVSDLYICGIMLLYICFSI